MIDCTRWATTSINMLLSDEHSRQRTNHILAPCLFELTRTLTSRVILARCNETG